MHDEKQIRVGQSARRKVMEGAAALERAVGSTLGPAGRNVTIQTKFGPVKNTKDGVTVARAVSASDNFVNLGVKLVRDAAQKTVDDVGDGTTTSTIIAHAVLERGLRALDNHLNVTKLRRHLEELVSTIHETLDGMSMPCNTVAAYKEVATISANGDEEIGQLMSEVMDSSGLEGPISVQVSHDGNTSFSYVDGMEIDRGFMSPYFVNTTEGLPRCVQQEPLVVVTDAVLRRQPDMVQFMQYGATHNRPILLICPDVVGEARRFLLTNAAQDRLDICWVRPPAMGDVRQAMLRDIAVLTGATYLGEDTGVKWAKFDPSWFGVLERADISAEKSLLVGSFGTSAQRHPSIDIATLDERIEEWKECFDGRLSELRAMREVAQNDYDRTKLTERIASLSGGVAAIYVGGVTETDANEKKDRVDDALFAVRAAMEGGTVVGGGAALAHASRKLSDIEGKYSDVEWRTAVDIIRSACLAPIRRLAHNAGMDTGYVEARLPEDVAIGWNAVTHEYCQLRDVGVIDPVKVTKAALKNGVICATLILQTDTFICEAQEESESDRPLIVGM